MKKIGIAVIVIVVFIAAAIVIKNELMSEVSNKAEQNHADDVFGQLKKHLPQK